MARRKRPARTFKKILPDPELNRVMQKKLAEPQSDTTITLTVPKSLVFLAGKMARKCQPPMKKNEYLTFVMVEHFNDILRLLDPNPPSPPKPGWDNLPF